MYINTIEISNIMINDYIKLKEEEKNFLNTPISDQELRIIDYRDNCSCVYCFEEAVFNLGFYKFKNVRLYKSNSRTDYIEGNNIVLPYLTCFEHLGRAVSNINPVYPIDLRDIHGKDIGQVFLIDKYIFLLDSFGNSNMYSAPTDHIQNAVADLEISAGAYCC